MAPAETVEGDVRDFLASLQKRGLLLVGPDGRGAAREQADMSETDIYGLIVARKEASEVLMKASEGRLYLPTVAIAKQTRPAQQITAQLKERWGLIGVCLGNDGLHDATKQRQYQIIEPRDPNWAPADGLCWVPRTNLNTSTCDGEELEVTEKALQPRASKGPFAAASWLDDLIRWMEPHLRSAGHSVTGKFEQLNASEFFNLIRFETNRGAVWFKAVGEPNLREFPITVGLAHRWPRFLPRLLGTRPEWHGWLMEEFGTELRDFMQLDRWKDAAVTLADLQIQSIGRSDELIAFGCHDMRLPKLLEDIDLFFETVAELMRQQPKTPPPILSRIELLELVRKLRLVCLQLLACGVPDCLLHGDFNPGSILVTSEGCVFTDWAEAYVGQPLVTFEHMLAHLRRAYPELEHWQEELRCAYVQCWESIVPSERVAEALCLAPVVAILNYALARGSWKDPEWIANPNVAKYIRSLARRMQREIEKLETSRTLCRS